MGQRALEAVDVVDMRIDDAVKLIRGKKGTEVRLTVKKLDGSIIIIPIIRDVVILEETYAKSALVDRNDIAVKVGYIRLPKFYADFNKKGGRNCAEDIKKELIKLKEEDIDGIILDLRNNRGGSLDDAVKMAGLFIEKGPIVQIKSRTGKPTILRDRDPMVYYDGPLIIMVNSFSASASEILAAAMQDYKRGIIIGSAATFGKGTVQRLINLDGYLPKDHGDIKSLGTLKLTTQKFYRIDGGATQLKGVYPDIILPDAYSYIDIGAKELEFAIPWDEILPVQFELWKPEAKRSNKINRLKKKSSSRIKKNFTFNLIIENAERFKKQRDKTTYSLNLKKYRDELKKVNEEAKKYNRIQKEIPELSIHSLKSDLSVIQSDSSKIQRTQAWHITLKKDVYLFEVIAVINDMKTFSQNKVKGTVYKSNFWRDTKTENWDKHYENVEVIITKKSITITLGDDTKKYLIKSIEIFSERQKYYLCTINNGNLKIYLGRNFDNTISIGIDGDFSIPGIKDIKEIEINTNN